MNTTSKKFFLAAALGIGILLTNAQLHAYSLTLKFDNVPATQCNDAWSEDNVNLSFVETTAEDCDGGGNCSFGIDPGQIWLFPGRLFMNFDRLDGRVREVDIDVIDHCGSGCTKAFFYEADGNVGTQENIAVGSEITLSWTEWNGGGIESVAISSCEGTVVEVRVEYFPANCFIVTAISP